jgi:hypothetical protein
VDRLLETSYEINPDQRAAVHAAVTRLLALAGIDLDEIRALLTDPWVICGRGGWVGGRRG